MARTCNIVIGSLHVHFETNDPISYSFPAHYVCESIFERNATGIESISGLHIYIIIMSVVLVLFDD